MWLENILLYHYSNHTQWAHGAQYQAVEGEDRRSEHIYDTVLGIQTNSHNLLYW